MTSKKKGSADRETKAGMLEKNGDSANVETEPAESKNNRQTTPKISKEKAEGQHDDKPVH